MKCPNCGTENRITPKQGFWEMLLCVACCGNCGYELEV